MTIRNRLKIVGIVPIVFLILLSGYFVITSYLNFEKANALKTILKNNAVLNNTLMQISKERGLTSLYLGSAGKNFSDSLSKQRVSTDKSFKTLKQKLLLTDTSYIPVFLNFPGQGDSINTAQYNKLLNNLNTVSALRKSVDHQNGDFKKIFYDGYTQKFATPTLDTIAQIKKFAPNTNISSLASSLLQISTAKENAELERGFVAYYMTKTSSMSVDEITLWKQFRTKANAFAIKDVNNDILHAKLEKVFNDSKAKEIFKKLEETSSFIQADVYSKGYAKEEIYWFTLQTKKITLLTKAESITSSELWEENEAYLQKQLIYFSIASLLLLVSFILAFLAYPSRKNIPATQVLEEATIENAEVKDEEVIQEPEHENNRADIESDHTEPIKVAIDEPSEKIILIAKKFLIEKKVLTKVIENLGYDHKVLDNTDLLENELTSANYDVLFTDKDLVTDSIRKSNDDLLVITSIHSKDEIVSLVNTHRG